MHKKPFDVEEYNPNFSEPFEVVYENLKALSTRLHALLPDPSIGPEERLERLARVVPKSVRATSNMQTGRTKLNRLRSRLDELVPVDMTYDEKLSLLVRKVEILVPGEGPFIDKLEQLGDYRWTDTGVVPRYKEMDR